MISLINRVPKLQFTGSNTRTNSQISRNNIPKELDQLFLAIPKAELHSHLAGSYPIETIKEIIKQNNSSTFPTTKEQYKNLTDFVKCYMSLAQPVKTASQLKKAVRSVCIDAAKNNVKYLELKVSSQELNPERVKTDSYNTKLKMYQAIKEAIKESKDELKSKGFNQTVKLMVTAERHEAAEVSMEDAKLAVELSKEKDPLVVGFDLAGDESRFSIERHSQSIKFAKDNGLHLTIHAGETPQSENLTPVQSMERAIEFGTERIGHGLAIFDSPNLAQKVKEKGITIENCPSSNVAIGLKNWGQKHLKEMLDRGIKVAVCTDDQTMFQTNLTEEFKRLYEHKIITSWQDIKKLVKNSIDGSFAPSPEKQKLAAEFDQELKNIENDPKFAKLINKYLNPANKFFVSCIESTINKFKIKEQKFEL